MSAKCQKRTRQLLRLYVDLTQLSSFLETAHPADLHAHCRPQGIASVRSPIRLDDLASVDRWTDLLQLNVSAMHPSPVAFRFQRSRDGNGAGRKRSRCCRSQPLPRAGARRLKDRRRDTKLPARATKCGVGLMIRITYWSQTGMLSIGVAPQLPTIVSQHEYLPWVSIRARGGKGR